MSMKVVGRGKNIVARVITLESGSKEKPWLVIKSDDAGVWPISAHRLRREAKKIAEAYNLEEDQRCEAINAKRGRKPEIPRWLFDDYYVRKYDRI